MRETAQDMFGTAMRIDGAKAQRNSPAWVTTSFGERILHVLGALARVGIDEAIVVELPSGHNRCARGAGDRSGSADSSAWRADAGAGARTQASGGGGAMKVLFAGPSCAKLLPSLRANPAFELRGPAAYGDVARAVLEGASAIGIVDGRFEDTRAVWHKEILFALSEGVAVAGAASMGALRATECAAFGMVGIGDVYRRYATGEFEDDGDVAQLHGPAELGFLALSEPLANIVATLEALEAEGLISAEESSALNLLARGLHYKERGYRRLFEVANLPPDRQAFLTAWTAKNAVDRKAEDAALLVEWLIAAPRERKKQGRFHIQRNQPMACFIGGNRGSAGRRLRRQAGAMEPRSIPDTISCNAGISVIVRTRSQKTTKLSSMASVRVLTGEGQRGPRADGNKATRRG